MKRNAKNSFSGSIKKPNGSGTFYFQANEFESDKYGLNVYGKATIGKLEAKLFYPKYLGKSDETVQNAGDLEVPEGTEIEWSIVAKNTNYVDFVFNSEKQRFKKEGFKVTKKLLSSSNLEFYLSNKHTSKLDSSKVTISVVKDAFPSINIEERKDSLSDGLFFFNGQVGDDYGLNSLVFVYAVISEDGKRKETRMSVKKVDEQRYYKVLSIVINQFFDRYKKHKPYRYSIIRSPRSFKYSGEKRNSYGVFTCSFGLWNVHV